MAMTAVTITQITYEELELLIEKSLRKIFLENQNDISEIKKLANDREPKLMTIEQSAKFLSLSKQTIYGLVSNNKIPFHKRGKRLYFYDKELTQWISNK
jgi:excisionase family DNA binding protein